MTDSPATEFALTEDPALIGNLEMQTFDAWRPLRQKQLDGWRLGCADGYTRRANSVYPLAYPADRAAEGGDVITAVEACEQWYSAQGQPTCFKLTSASQPVGLDGMLAARGYTLLPGAFVLTMALSGDRRVIWADGSDDSDDDTAAVMTDFTDAWLEQLCRINPGQARYASIIQQMLAGSNAADPAERYFATGFHEGMPVAVGLAVRHGAYVGLFDIVTHPEARRQGHGRRLVQHLLKAAALSGAHTAYLQVTEFNAPAITLYRSLGFIPVYRYWYRQRG